MSTEEEMLENLRGEIDQIDYRIHDLLNQRAQIALKVAAEKLKFNPQLIDQPNFYRPVREQEILARVREYNKGPLSDTAICNIFTTVIHECRVIQQNFIENRPEKNKKKPK